MNEHMSGRPRYSLNETQISVICLEIITEAAEAL